MASLSAPEITSLSLAQIQQVRDTDAWRAYAQSLRALLRAPANFAELAPGVQAAYAEMLRAAGPVSGREATRLDLALAPKLLIHIAGATIEAMWAGDTVVWERRGRVSELAPIDRAPLSLQFTVGDQHGGAGWGAVTEFHRGTIANPAAVLRELTERFDRQTGFHRADLVDTERLTTLNTPR
jgi:hypothetical protein